MTETAGGPLIDGLEGDRIELEQAIVSIDVKPRADGCVVRLREKPVAGPATLVPSWLLDTLLHRRNVETLRRLAFIAEGRPGTL